MAAGGRTEPLANPTRVAEHEVAPVRRISSIGGVIGGKFYSGDTLDVCAALS